MLPGPCFFATFPGFGAGLSSFESYLCSFADLTGSVTALSVLITSLLAAGRSARDSYRFIGAVRSETAGPNLVFHDLFQAHHVFDFLLLEITPTGLNFVVTFGVGDELVISPEGIEPSTQFVN